MYCGRNFPADVTYVQAVNSLCSSSPDDSKPSEIQPQAWTHTHVSFDDCVGISGTPDGLV